jgi:multimeric flavodoxin WrbA
VATLLVVHHTASPATADLLDRVRAGATDPAIEGVTVRVEPALGATATDVLQADGYLLGTPANLGYMSGALKHFFDTIYYPCLDATTHRPFGLWLHGNNDTDGAALAVDKITTGLRWRQAAETVSVIGPPAPDDLDACWNLGATLAAALTLDD